MVWQRRTWDELAPIRARITAMITDRPRLEASWYGPLTKYIGSQLDDHTMLKPQGPLRDRDSDGLIHDPDDSFTSEASYGAITPGGNPTYPDFMLCKFTASPYNDTLKAVIEVKHPGAELQAIEDLTRYLNLHGDNTVLGIAIAGRCVVAIRSNQLHDAGYSTLWEVDLLEENFIDRMFNLAQ